jgi:hypothetical protein
LPCHTALSRVLHSSTGTFQVAAAAATSLVPAVRNRARPAGALAAVNRGIHGRLLDHDVAPLRVQLLGDDQRKRRLDALTDLRALAEDEYRALSRNAQECVRHEIARGSRGRLRITDLECQHQSTAGQSAELEEAAAIQRQGAQLRGRDAQLDVAHELTQGRIRAGNRIHARVHRAFSCAIFSAAL